MFFDYVPTSLTIQPIPLKMYLSGFLPNSPQFTRGYLEGIQNLHTNHRVALSNYEPEMVSSFDMGLNDMYGELLLRLLN